jgi:hypothetical protein
VRSASRGEAGREMGKQSKGQCHRALGGLWETGEQMRRTQGRVVGMAWQQEGQWERALGGTLEKRTLGMGSEKGEWKREGE